MKINAVSPNFNASKTKHNSRENNQKPSFKAKVSIIEDVYDVISLSSVNITKEPLKKLVELILPRLQKMDDALKFVVSGAGEEPNLSNFISPPRLGLKFDINFWDGKKFWHDLVTGDPNRLKPNYLEGLKRKDMVLGVHLDDKFCTGKLYYPDKGETPQMYADTVIDMINNSIYNAPYWILESSDEIRHNVEKGIFEHVSSRRYHYGDRRLNEKYIGIEVVKQKFP